MIQLRYITCLLLCSALGACSSSPSNYYTSGEPYKPNAAPFRATSKPYQIKGIWYYPQQHYEYNEMGLASWYGPGFHKKRTSTGEIFDMNKVSAAHKTLPLPCVAMVTNLENGKMLKVKVNDRGPFVEGRIIDLSKKAAEILGVHIPGTAKVKVETLVEESVALNAMIGKPDAFEMPVQAAPREQIQVTPLPGSPVAQVADQPWSKRPVAPFRTPRILGPSSQDIPDVPAEVKQGRVQNYRQIYLQVGAFAKSANAAGVVAKLSPLGRTFTQQIYFGSQPIYRVRMGPFITPEKADATLKRVINMGLKDAQIIVE